MKKILCLFISMLFCIFIFSSCKTKRRGEIESTISGESTVESHYTTMINETTTDINRAFAETRNTEATKEEPEEIQAKIDINRYDEYVPSKVIFTCGDKRDVPYLVMGMAIFFDEEINMIQTWDGYAMFGYIDYKVKENEKYYPVFTASSEDELIVYINDVSYGEQKITIVDENNKNLKTYDNITATSDLNRGRYYAYIEITCYGDCIHEHGNVSTEFIYYRAYFILELI